jgi:indolepyruvate ferredoxin oxidoreductase
MATFSDPNTDMHSQMGGEGLAWIGAAPFTDEPHVFANLGDGTYNHSGSLAIRASVAAKSNITYKLLFNDAVAMTGGQAAESGFTPPQITRQLASEGVARTVIVADDPTRYEGVTDLAPGVTVRHRDELMDVQKELRETPGTTVLLYDQVCATEKRRRQKRGKMAKSATKPFINAAVCEGCGDCSRTSNCVSVEPLNTPFGRKRKINQSSCNTDLSCVQGFCPSFVTLTGAEPAKAERTLPALTADSTPLPETEPLEGVRNIVFTGIGGTGVTTVASILAMAAHVDGRAASVVDMTGLAQKGGSVFSHVRIGETEASVVGGRVPAASANVVVACDLLVAAGPEALALYAKDRTTVVGNADFSPTADFVTNRDIRFDTATMARKIGRAVKAYDACPAHHLAETRLGDAIFANMIMLGFAWQKGQVPVSSRALYRSIKLNGVDAERNLQAFEIGRMAAHDPASMGPADADVPTPETEPLDALIERRITDLALYQDAAYAERYRRRIEQVRAAEAPLNSDKLTRAAAVSLYQLMAYKDEYEVARLYTDGRFKAALDGAFKGGTLKVWMAPPLISRKGSDGRPKKMAFGAWMIRYAFPVMAKMKGLRGGALDVFGRTDERRMERRLIADYEATLDRLLAGLSAERLPLADRIAAAPQNIRGFGHIKDAAVTKVEADTAKLWVEWEAEVKLAA